ncbi:MAG: hypothetical protein LBE61_14110 [Burkholderiaceae bacterium]|jgi:hypothetical protein|nr:hypothetical protein [Burkholderiaceae bacterium]
MRWSFIARVSSNPESGDVIPGAEGTHKVRWTVKGTGKRGGARLIYFNLTVDEIVLLVAVHTKALKEMIMTTKKDLRDLDVEVAAKAIEPDTGESFAGLREALTQAKADKYAATHTPEQIATRKPADRLVPQKQMPSCRQPFVSIRMCLRR